MTLEFSSLFNQCYTKPRLLPCDCLVTNLLMMMIIMMTICRILICPCCNTMLIALALHCACCPCRKQPGLTLKVTSAPTANPAPARTARGMGISCHRSGTLTMSAMTGTERVRTPSSRSLLPRVSTFFVDGGPSFCDVQSFFTCPCLTEMSAFWLAPFASGADDQEMKEI